MSSTTLVDELVDALIAARNDPDRTADLVVLWARNDPETLTSALVYMRALTLRRVRTYVIPADFMTRRGRDGWKEEVR